MGEFPDQAVAAPIPPLLLDERQACAALGGISCRTLFNLRRRGLPFVRVGSRIMYRPADLAAWVNAQLQREPILQEVGR